MAATNTADTPQKSRSTAASAGTAAKPTTKQAIGNASDKTSDLLAEQNSLVDKVQEALQQEDSLTRQRIARQFVTIYFALLALLLVGIPIYNIIVIRVTQRADLVIKLTDIIQTYSAVVGPTLGFVIAYYFKSKSDA